MSNKTNKGPSYAEQGLEAVNAEYNQAESAIVAAGANGPGEDDFQQVGGSEPVAFFYRTSAPKKPTKSPFKVISKGETIEGTYERSFISGKFNNPTYIVRLANGTLVGLPGAGSLKKGMEKLAEGSKVKVIYNGMSPIKTGQWEGTDAHNFTVFGTKLKA